MCIRDSFYSEEIAVQIIVGEKLFLHIVDQADLGILDRGFVLTQGDDLGIIFVCSSPMWPSWTTS